MNANSGNLFKLIIVNALVIEEFWVTEVSIDSSSVGSFSVFKGHAPMLLFVEHKDLLTIFFEDLTTRKIENISGFFQVGDDASFLLI